MKQFKLGYLSKKEFIKDLDSLANELKEMKKFYFHIFSTSLDAALMKECATTIQEKFPGARCIGNSTAGNISDSESAPEILVACNAFEKEDSKFEIRHYDFNKMEMAEISAKIIKEAEENQWIKAVEIFHTVPKASTSILCDGLKGLRKDIQVFGGIVCSTDITSSESFVYSSDYGKLTDGLLCVFFGGQNLHFDSIRISGWKPIGRTFRVTKAEGNILKQLSGIPAYEIYKKYLNIKNDSNFFINALDFPMMYEHNDTTIVRAAAASNEDGSITVSANVEEGEIIRLSYGEPRTIIESIHEKSLSMMKFEPQVMHIFSCAARKAFWSTYTPTYELKSLENLCKSTGFFSHGEFLREKGNLNQHNLTLVIASIREGDLKEKEYKGNVEVNEELTSSKIPLAARMATFIRETSFELEQTNSKLEIMNHQLQDVATTDALTGLENRLSFNEKLHEIEHNATEKDNWVMYMYDVNGLKYINDTFGHSAGDELIKSAAAVLLGVYKDCACCYRIGGDEFVMLINVSDKELYETESKFNKNLEEHNKTALYHLSIAKGKSSRVDRTGHVRSISDWKLDADLNMYRNKANAHSQRKTAKDENLRQLIDCLITVEEAKDPYTACHSDRVKSLSSAIAKKMGLTEETISLITDAAALHDIGKVGILDAVLLKPGKLTDDEFMQIKEHPVIGAKILMKSNYMQEFVQIVLHHHERYDGSGYPDRLKGDAIPLGARIVAIADSIDAMTSKRIYRDALSLETCRQEIEKNIGRMYDPAIAKIALENWSCIEEIIMANPIDLIEGKGE